MRASRRLVLSALGIVVVAIILGGSGAARAAGELPEEERRDAAELRSASWVICDFGSDAAAGIPEAMTWNWNKRQFEPKPNAERASGVVVIFDDENRRAGFFDAKKTEDGSFSVEQEKGPPSEALHLFRDELLTVVRLEPPPPPVSFWEVTLAISYQRGPDRRFTAIVHVFPLRLFSYDIDPVYMPGACATTAEEPLKEALEAARAKWLSEPVTTPEAPPPPPPPPPPEDQKSEQ
jgi:hypothetical protein